MRAAAGRLLGVKVAHLATEFDKAIVVESGEANLDGSGIVEPSISREVGGQTLSEWCESLSSLRAVKECRRTGDQQVQTRESTAVGLVKHLAQCVERFVSGIGADPLESLDLVDHQEQSGMAAVPEDSQQPLRRMTAPLRGRFLL